MAAKMRDLFDGTPHARVRRKPRALMHVAGAGEAPWGPTIRLKCGACNFDTDWITDRWSVSENRRGHPCPNCNPDDEEAASFRVNDSE